MSKRSRVELEQDMARANEAKGLLASEVFESALSFVESSALSMCRTAQSAEESFTGTLRAQAAQSMRTVMHAFIAHGESAARALTDQASARREEFESDEDHSNYLNAASRARSAVDHSATASRENE
jgi:hypothetical protein